MRHIPSYTYIRVYNFESDSEWGGEDIEEMINTLGYLLNPKDLCFTYPKYVNGFSPSSDNQDITTVLSDWFSRWGLNSITWHNVNHYSPEIDEYSKKTRLFFKPKEDPNNTKYVLGSTWHRKYNEKPHDHKDPQSSECGRLFQDIAIRLDGDLQATKDVTKFQLPQFEIIDPYCNRRPKLQEIRQLIFERYNIYPNDDGRKAETKMRWQKNAVFLRGKITYPTREEAEECVCCGNK